MTFPSLVQPDNAIGRDSGTTEWSLELNAHHLLEKTRRTPGVELAPFTTDGCSGGLSSSWTLLADQFPEFSAAHNQAPPWEQCCLDHDRAYHSAGKDPEPSKSYSARLVADRKLQACVIQTGQKRYESLAELYEVTESQVDQAYRVIASSMYASVRVGGAPCSGLSWRWGYGYPQCRWFD